MFRLVRVGSSMFPASSFQFNLFVRLDHRHTGSVQLATFRPWTVVISAPDLVFSDVYRSNADVPAANCSHESFSEAPNSITGNFGRSFRLSDKRERFKASKSINGK